MKTNYKNPAAAEWYRSMASDPADFPFYFKYNGKEYCGFKNLT